MPKYCTNCGNKLVEGIKFCTSCGNKVEDVTPPPEQPVAPQQIPVAPPPPPPSQVPKKPKTKIFALIAIIIVAVIIIVVLFFFVFQNNTATTGDTSDFIGSWDATFILGVSSPDQTFTFYTNGSMKITSGFTEEWNTFDITGGRLCWTSVYYQYYHCYDYELSAGGSTLTLKQDSQTTHIFNKIA